MSIYEEAAEDARRMYWNKRGRPGSVDRMPSEQAESILEALCGIIQSLSDEVIRLRDDLEDLETRVDG